MKKTSDLSDHIKRTMPKRDIQEGRESVQMFVEMLKHHKIDVVDDEVLNRTYETEDYVDEKILSLILETLKIDEPIQYIPRYMRSMNAFQAGGTTVVVVDELLEYTLLSFLFTMYADEGISGTQVKHRVQFQQMIEDRQWNSTMRRTSESLSMQRPGRLRFSHAQRKTRMQSSSAMRKASRIMPSA